MAGDEDLAIKLRLMLPIAHINGLCKNTQVRHCMWLTNAGDLVLDAVQKFGVKKVLESTISITLELTC